MIPKKRKVRWGWVAVLGVTLSGGGYFAWQQAANAGKAGALPKGVQIGKAARGNIDQKITATGVVAAQIGAKVNIGSQISGRIRSLPADVGTRVRAQQVVAVIDSPDLQAQVEQQRQSVAVAEASRMAARSRLEQASLNAGLSKEQTQAQIDEADFALKAANARLQMSQATAELQPTQTRTEITRAEAALSTSKSAEQLVRQTVNQQLLQAQTNIDDLKSEVNRLQQLRKRREALLAEGYIARQEVDDVRAQHQQAIARMQSAVANLDIVKEKTAADLQNARDQVAQSTAALEAAKAGTLQNTMREAEVRSARETMRQAQASLALRRTNKTADRIQDRAFQEARASLDQSTASLKQARALLNYQQAQLDKAVIRSPINGTVLSIAAQQGETLAAGFQTPTLITVADLNRLEVRAYVDETDIGRMRLGLPAQVRVESYQGRVFEGRVTKIASASTVKDNVVTYETTVAIQNTEGLLRPDMTADVTLLLGRQENVLNIPSEAVHREIDRTIVYVLHRAKPEKERVETREVRAGVDDGSKTEILSGLKEGEEVVLAGLQRLGVTATDAQSNQDRKDEK